MRVMIRSAVSAEDIDGIFRARHRVYAELDRYLPITRDGRLIDRFDAFPTTHNVLAEHDGYVVGGVRFTLSSAVGTPPEEYFDFAPYLAAHAAAYGAGSMLFLEPIYRNTRVTFHLLAAGYSWLIAAGADRVIGIVHDTYAPTFLRHGYRPLAETQIDRQYGVPFVPMMLDLTDLDAAMREAVRLPVTSCEIDAPGA